MMTLLEGVSRISCSFINYNHRHDPSASFEIQWCFWIFHKIPCVWLLFLRTITVLIAESIICEIIILRKILISFSENKSFHRDCLISLFLSLRRMNSKFNIDDTLKSNMKIRHKMWNIWEVTWMEVWIRRFRNKNIYTYIN